MRKKLICSYLALLGCAAWGHDATLSTVEVRADHEDVVGIASAGSEGVVSGERLRAVPLQRAAEALEMVPGLVVTQHSGDGKANQYYLRGFNLDHGTDFRTTVAGVPVNLPTHAHGQGYSDLNFLIPELISQVRFRKGPYYADEGDFSSAGAAHFDYVDALDEHLASLAVGRKGYGRTLLAGSPQLAAGRMLYGLELFHNDGPWEVPEHYRKFNGVLRYSRGDGFDGFKLSAMHYQADWTATDQVPQRALDTGLLGRFGSLDDTTGGKTRRTSLSGQWAARGENAQSRANVWWLNYSLDLWSNFTYAMDRPAQGDQFLQKDRRQAGGFDASHTTYGHWLGKDVENVVGIEQRVDLIQPVGLYTTSARTVTSTTREDRVRQQSLAIWLQNHTHWTSWMRSVLGLRANRYNFVVDSNLLPNSGKAQDSLVTPKLSLIFGPWQSTEVYFNYGHGFHSNDARGATTTQDPSTLAPVSKVDPLVRTRGAEVGMRSEPVKGWKTTLALWQLDIDSELLFVGDAGSTEVSRPSRRRGLEWSNFYVPRPGWALDADLAWSQSRFQDSDPAGAHVPGAVGFTANMGVTVDAWGPWFGALRLRHFGPRPLIEDSSVRSHSTTLTNLRLGYKLDPKTTLALDVFNLFNSKVSDIDYYYQSQLRGEASTRWDIHSHPVEPLNLRLSLNARF